MRRPQMNTNDFFLWLAASALSGAFCVLSAMAEVHPAPTEAHLAYKKLTAVELAPVKTPLIQTGFSKLSGTEATYGERLPLQLKGPIKLVGSHQPARKSKVRHLRF